MSKVVRAGPDILYADAVSTPQLANRGDWNAAPIMISGASAYRSGEFLYQDYLFDDHGANTNGSGASNLGSSGDYTYPTAAAYATNAADIVEIRIKPLATGTALRITYNAMLDPALVATTIALGGSSLSQPMPHGANTKAPATRFVTVHGATGDIVDADTGAVLGIAPTVSVDMASRQVDVLVPYDAFDPRGQTAVRIAAAAGLWDAATGAYLLPQTTADAAHPGGRGGQSAPSAFFNVAFRYAEPLNGLNNNFGNSWREWQQADALQAGDISPFFATVNFVKLAANTSDDMLNQPGGVPTAGAIDRIYVSKYESAQGRGTAASLAPENCTSGCVPNYASRLQPYSIYVPAVEPEGGFGLALDIHGAGVTYNTYLGTQRSLDFSSIAKPAIVLTPEARGEAYWYYGQALADVFEAWADVSRNYRIDTSAVTISGISMGGFGTYKIASMFPDLFAAAAPFIPCPSAGVLYDGTNEPGGVASFNLWSVASLRHVPVSVWSGSVDTVCFGGGARGGDAIIKTLDELGYQYSSYSLQGMGHAVLPTYQQQVAFIRNARVVVDPAHVTYSMNAALGMSDQGLNNDHAYWLSEIKLRNATTIPPVGTVDVKSNGFGVADPVLKASVDRSGFINCAANCVSTAIPPFPLGFASKERTWDAAKAASVDNSLTITATNIASLTIDTARAKIDCAAKLNVTSDGPISITLAGCANRVNEVH